MDLLEGPGVDQVSGLLRVVYAAGVGGSDQDWAALGATMAREEHTVVLVLPARLYSNPDG